MKIDASVLQIRDTVAPPKNLDTRGPLHTLLRFILSNATVSTDDSHWPEFFLRCYFFSFNANNSALLLENKRKLPSWKIHSCRTPMFESSHNEEITEQFFIGQKLLCVINKATRWYQAINAWDYNISVPNESSCDNVQLDINVDILWLTILLISHLWFKISLTSVKWSFI